jgi:transcriptional regulator with XRE-family HTH domain
MAPVLWLWTNDEARKALASRQLATILRAYRTATGTSQRQLADLLGYDTTYISMIETGRREVSDVSARLRIARRLGLPVHALGVTDPDDADFTAMLQFGESAIRLAVLARQSGHGAEAINELWPLVTRLERRAADGHVERNVMHLLIRARAELGVSLGYVLPEERLAGAARWTGRALRLAETLADRDLLAYTLRVHGNELRKTGRLSAAVTRLQLATDLAGDRDRPLCLIQLARAAGEIGHAALFDSTLEQAQLSAEADTGIALSSRCALHETHLRGLLQTGRTREAVNRLDSLPPNSTALPSQWQAIVDVTTGEVLLARGDTKQASASFSEGLTIARQHRLPHQVQRVIRATATKLPELSTLACQVLSALRTVRPRSASE